MLAVDPATIPAQCLALFVTRFTRISNYRIICPHNKDGFPRSSNQMVVNCKQCMIDFVFFTAYLHRRSFYPVTAKQDKLRPVHILYGSTKERDISRGMKLDQMCKRYVMMKQVLLCELGRDVGPLICQEVISIVSRQTNAWLAERLAAQPAYAGLTFDPQAAKN